MHALWLKLCLKNHCLGSTRWISNRYAPVELVTSEVPSGVSSFTAGEGNSVVSTANPTTVGAPRPGVSPSAVPCGEYWCVPGPPLYRQGESRPPNARGGFDQISGQHEGQAEADTKSTENEQQKIVVWVALIAMLSELVLVVATTRYAPAAAPLLLMCTNVY